MQPPFLHIIMLYYMQKIKKIIEITAYFVSKHMQQLSSAQFMGDTYLSNTKQENLYADYQEKAAKWEETYETKAKSDTVHVRIQNYQREESVRQSKQTTQRKIYVFKY